MTMPAATTQAAVDTAPARNGSGIALAAGFALLFVAGCLLWVRAAPVIFLDALNAVWSCL